MKKSAKYLLCITLVVALIALTFVYFKTNVYKVVYYVDNEVYETVTIRKNHKTERPENPVKDGYMFIGWYDEEGNNFNFNNNITANIRLFGQFGKIVDN